jgi:hypothetical protein
MRQLIPPGVSAELHFDERQANIFAKVRVDPY